MIKIKDSAVVFIVAIMMFSIKKSASYRILCLHGSGGNGKLFEERLTPLKHFVQLERDDSYSISTLATSGTIEKCSRFEFLFPTAPFPAPTIGTITGTNDNRVWWQLPEGKRSFNANRLEGIHESLHIINELTPFDAIISFSQGAMLAAVYLSNQIIEHHHHSSSDHDAVSKAVIKPLKCIFIGAGIPSCYSNLFKSIHAIQRNHDQNAGHFKTLHVVGRRDIVNPTFMGEELASVFNGQLHVHDDGHVIPLDSCSLEVISKFIIDE